MELAASLFPGIVVSYFFFNDTATTEIYTLSLHDALPIYLFLRYIKVYFYACCSQLIFLKVDRKSGSAGMPRPISYAVFCLKKNESHKPPLLRFLLGASSFRAPGGTTTPPLGRCLLGAASCRALGVTKKSARYRFFFF